MIVAGSVVSKTVTQRANDDRELMVAVPVEVASGVVSQTGQ